MTATPPAQFPHFLKHISLFLIGTLLFWTLGAFYCLALGYQDSFLSLNALRSPFWDKLMPHITHLGDGLLLSSLMGFFLLQDKKAELINLIIALILISLLISLSKSYLFSHWYRPLKVFENSQEFYYISLDRLTRRSFPSGHSAAAGVILTFAAFAWERQQKILGLIAAVLLILISYSRLYIGVHFLGDILVGSFIGCLGSLLAIRFFHPRLSRYFSSLQPKSEHRWTLALYAFLSLVLLADVYRLFSVYYGEMSFS